MNRIRVTCLDGLPHHATVSQVNDDGSTTPLTDNVVSVTVHIERDQLASATVVFEVDEVDVVAVVP